MSVFTKFQFFFSTCLKVFFLLLGQTIKTPNREKPLIMYVQEDKNHTYSSYQITQWLSKRIGNLKTSKKTFIQECLFITYLLCLIIII